MLLHVRCLILRKYWELFPCLEYRGGSPMTCYLSAHFVSLSGVRHVIDSPSGALILIFYEK